MKIIDDEKENIKLFQHDTKKRSMNFLTTYYPFIILLSGIYIYILSLERCVLDSEAECYKIFFPKVGQLLFTCVFSCLLFSINYVLPLLHKTKITTFTFILTFISQCFLYISDDGTNFQSHGGYNRILLILMTIIFIIVESMVVALIIFYKRISKIYSLTFIVIISFYFFFIIIPKFTSSCVNWQKGLKNSSLNNEVGCKLVIPKTCWLYIFDGLFDFSKITGINCKSHIDDASVEEFYNKAKIIAFPETQLFNFTERSYRYLQKNVLENVIDISNLSHEEQMEHEVILDRTDIKAPKVKINVHKNYNLIIKKKK